MKGSDIRSELLKKNFPEPGSWGLHTQTDGCNQEVRYIQLYFQEATICEKILRELDITFLEQKILIVPMLANVSLDTIIAHHQVVFKFEAVADLMVSSVFIQKAQSEPFHLNKEVNALFAFFSQLGPVIDMNLDFYPEFIVTTFQRHRDVQKIIEQGVLQYTNSNQTLQRLQASKIDFICPVKNCKQANQSVF